MEGEAPETALTMRRAANGEIELDVTSGAASRRVALGADGACRVEPCAKAARN